MFTGLVEQLGTVVHTHHEQVGCRIQVRSTFSHEVTLGESIAVNGVCLTAVSIEGEVIAYDVGPETLLRTNLGSLQPGNQVNLERSLRVGDRIGGHFVQGHIDQVGTIIQRQRSGDWDDIWFETTSEMSSLLIPKGSIAIDGISLTVVSVHESRFNVMLIPHTQAITTLGFKQVGDLVNLEFDMLAKHVARLLVANPYRA